jgi:hypothetical protein
LPLDIREACEQQANAAKERFYAELSEYKKTQEYSQYQDYLVDFKAKHRNPRTGEYDQSLPPPWFKLTPHRRETLKG